MIDWPMRGAGKVLLLGQAPGNYARYTAKYALFPWPRGCAGYRLQKMMGVYLGTYMRTFDRANLLDDFPGHDNGGDKFPIHAAMEAAGKMAPSLVNRDVVMVGRDVARAFSVGDAPWFEWRTLSVPLGEDDVQRLLPGAKLVGLPVVDLFKFVVVPHTSGRNRWWNDPDNKERGRTFLEELAGWARQTS